METQLLLITGGARSGKSRFAFSIAEKMEGRKVFLATAQPRDEEMRVRIEAHRAARPAEWATLEEAYALASALKGCYGNYEIVLIDCLTMWMSNLLTIRALSESEIIKEVHTLLAVCKRLPGTVLMVSNEVGSGIIPENPLARLFCDVAGRAHQDIASHADAVYLVVAGIPVHLKGKTLEEIIGQG